MAETLTVIQITDTHLHGQANELFKGVDTRASLQAVLDLIRQRAQPPDLLLATGDLAHDGSTEAYRALRAQLLSLDDIPVYWLPGNHDEPGAMQAALPGDNVKSSTVFVSAGTWQIVLLDTTVPGMLSGRLGATELDRLDQALSARPHQHALVCLHHHPLPIGSAWMDEAGLEDAEQFFAVLRRHTQVRAVVCGHVHQEFAAEHAGVQVLAAPSTCAQFKPNSPMLVVDELTAGYRWLELHVDGHITTGVERL